MSDLIGLNSGNYLSNKSSYFDPMYNTIGSNFGAATSAPSFTSKLTSFLTNPIAGLATQGIGLIAGGINSWLNRRKEEQARKEAQKRYDEQIAFERQKYADQLKMQQEQLKLSKITTMSNLQQQKFENEQYIGKENESRKNQWYQNFIQQINSPDNANKLLQIYGR